MPTKPFNYKKSVQAFNLLAHLEGGMINKMKALKLIWLADRLHLRIYGRPIISDRYVAMKHGPVASSSRDILEGNSRSFTDDVIGYASGFILPVNKEYRSVADVDEKVFSRTDIDCLKRVYESFGNMDKYDIRDFTHLFPEWSDPQSKGLKAIPMNYEDFFKNTSQYIELFDQDEELLELSKEAFTY